MEYRDPDVVEKVNPFRSECVEITNKKVKDNVNIHVYTSLKGKKHIVFRSKPEKVDTYVYIISTLVCAAHCVCCILFLFISVSKYIQLSVDVLMCLVSLWYNKNIASRKLIGIRWWLCTSIQNEEGHCFCLEVKGSRKDIGGWNKALYVIFNGAPIVCYVIQMILAFFTLGIFSIYRLLENCFFVLLSSVNLVMCGVGRSLHLHHMIKQYKTKKIEKFKESRRDGEQGNKL